MAQLETKLLCPFKAVVCAALQAFLGIIGSQVVPGDWIVLLGGLDQPLLGFLHIPRHAPPRFIQKSHGTLRVGIACLRVTKNQPHCCYIIGTHDGSSNGRKIVFVVHLRPCYGWGRSNGKNPEDLVLYLRQAAVAWRLVGMKTGERFERAVEIMHRLRAPGGCPWDREQTFDSITKYTVEETYEVLEAIEQRDWEELPGELGDLLLQVLFYAEMAEEAGHFSIDQVLETLSEKLVRRHPHVFGEVEAATSQEVLKNWEAIKQQEKAAKAAGAGSGNASLPAAGAEAGNASLPRAQRRVTLRCRRAQRRSTNLFWIR